MGLPDRTHHRLRQTKFKCGAGTVLHEHLLNGYLYLVGWAQLLILALECSTGFSLLLL